jgi:hypothetical protein
MFTTMTQEEIDEYMSWTAGEEAPPAGALDIRALANLMFGDIEMYRPTSMCVTLTKHLDTETGAQRKSIKIKILP